MSQFIKKLKQASESPARAFGFKAAVVKEKRGLILVVRLEGQKGEPKADGADAVILLPAQVGELKKASVDAIQGCWLAAADKKVSKKTAKDCDFFVFPQDTSLAVLEDIEAGKVLEVPDSLEDSLLRGLVKLPVDAVLVAATKNNTSLTLRRLMDIQRFVGLPGKPALVAVDANISPAELQALCDAGVSGVVIDGTALPESRLAELRKAIDGLKPPAKKADGKFQPLLPRASAVTAPDDEGDDAGEEGEEEED